MLAKEPVEVITEELCSEPGAFRTRIRWVVPNIWSQGIWDSTYSLCRV